MNLTFSGSVISQELSVTNESDFGTNQSNDECFIQQLLETVINNNCTCNIAGDYTDEHLKTATRIFNQILTPLVCGFGIISNLLNLVILAHRKLDQSPYTYLRLLAVADLMVLLLTFVFYTISLEKDTYIWKIYNCKVFYPIGNIFVTSSIWLSMILTADRFCFVRYPLHAKTMCNRSCAKLKSAIVFCVSCFVNIPNFFMFYVEWDSKKNSYITQFSSYFSKSETLVFQWLHILLVNVIPLCMLICINFYLVYAVQRARKLRGCLQAKGRQKSGSLDQQRMTVTLISITFLFISCTTMSAFLRQPIAVAFYGGLQFVRTYFFQLLRAVSNFLMIINHSMNFVMYCAFNRKFRRALRMTIRRWCYILCCKLSKKESKTISMVTSERPGSRPRPRLRPNPAIFFNPDPG